MNIDYSKLTEEQRSAVKEGLRQQLEQAMNTRGMKSDSNKLIIKYAFLKKKQIKRIKRVMVLTTATGKKIHVRIF